MSAQANLVAFDGAASPVSHTLVALGTSRESNSTMAEWAERLPTVPLNAQVGAIARRRMLKSGQEQASISVKVPFMETISGANASGYTAASKVAHEITYVITEYVDPRATETERKIAKQLAVNIFGGVTTTVTPVTTGPAAELFVQGIMAS